nr:helix-turn-helix domain-containing protein [Paenibacillus odorifer]
MKNNIIAIKRKKLDKTQEVMAKDLNISRQHYNAVENFKKSPSVELAKDVAQRLDLNWTIFFDNQVNIQATKKGE